MYIPFCSVKTFVGDFCLQNTPKTQKTHFNIAKICCNLTDQNVTFKDGRTQMYCCGGGYGVVKKFKNIFVSFKISKKRRKKKKEKKFKCGVT